MTATYTNTVEVKFTITLDHQYFYTEDEIQHADAALSDQIGKAALIEGSIDIIYANAPENRIIDELAPWIQNLCFLALPKLSAGADERIFYFSRSGFLDLQPVEDKIRISGNKNNEVLYPAREIMEALFNCGHRFITIMKEVKRDDPAYMANIHYISQFESQARAALVDP